MSTAAEQQLLDGLKRYELALGVSVQQAAKTGRNDAITQQIINDKTPSIEGGMVKVGTSVVQGNFSQAAASLIGVAIQGISGSQLYQSDNYKGAAMAFYYILGSGDNYLIGDSDVPRGLQLWEEKLGVFISGSEHVMALTKSADAYMNYFSVNGYTTMDRVRVQLAVNVMSEYAGRIAPHSTLNRGCCADMVGVYDNAVTAAIVQSRVNDPSAQTDTSGSVTESSLSALSWLSYWANNLGSMGVVLVGGVLLLVVYALAILFSGDKD